jgi:hypothetical protein
MERHAQHLPLAALALIGVGLFGCLAPASNEGLLPPLPGTNPDAGATPPPGSPTTPGTPSTPGAPTTPGAPVVPGTPVPNDGGTPSVDAGQPPAGGPGLPSLAGTGAACYTYTPRSGDKCFGKFCGVTAAQIDAALVKPRIGRCSLVPPEYACQGIVIREVAGCSRFERAQAVPFRPNVQPEELRPQVQACVYRNTAIDPNVVTPDCLGCYLDSAECSGRRCLDACILGDSPDCDACRQANGCNDPVAACAGFPDPR